MVMAVFSFGIDQLLTIRYGKDEQMIRAYINFTDENWRILIRHSCNYLSMT